MLLLHLKADKELNILFVLRIFLQIIAVLALLEFHIALAALDDRTCLTCRKWSLQVLGLQGKYSLQGQQVRSSLHSPAQGPRDFPDVVAASRVAFHIRRVAEVPTIRLNAGHGERL